ncbi:MAG: UDP-N-acetylglucosamine 2-epimerase [Candidatus Woesearchaeota archaeon]|jgi:UDP-N-acetylglucosamine 2-epimerase (non-hydrolysing)
MFETIQNKAIIPDILPLSIDKTRIAATMNDAKKRKMWVLCFIIGTKPCINKFYGAITHCLKNNIPLIVINSNQHYDSALTKGLEEFDYLKEISVNLNLRGDLSQKSGELFFKLKWFAKYLKENWSDVTTVPVINGDVIVAAIAPAAWMFTRGEKAINMESGLRSMSPNSLIKLKEKKYTLSETETFVEEQWNGKWNLMTNEPYPEQWDTFVSAKGCHYHFAPLQINKDHLLREGYPEKRIFVSGAVVIDAWKELEKRKPMKSIFEIYPKLENEAWLRVDIHRKENTTERRFKTVIAGLKTLVDKGHNINLVGMNATEYAIKKYNLTPIIDEMKKKKNFLYTPLWPEFQNVMEFYKSKHNLVPITDSGGLQEDMNYWRKPCITVRFSSDRPESIKDSHSNILIPPFHEKQFSSQIHNIIENESILKKMAKAKYIYGQGFGEKFSKKVKELMETEYPYTWTHEEIGLWKEQDHVDF